MLFNLEKCSIMHMGKKNHELSYEMAECKVLKVRKKWIWIYYRYAKGC